jgi:high-affinity Fe2+/Pb2+ permease
VYETLLITFREGLEAFLMVAVATLFLRKTGRGALVMAVRSGLGVSIVGSVLLGVLLARVGFSLAWLIEYLGISTTRSFCARMAWHDRRDCGSSPQARSSRSSSSSSAR